MKPPVLFALALLWSTGILAQEPARQNDMTLKATEVPSTIDFQGRLHDSGGSPVNATLSIKFSLYDVGSGGTALWSETKSVQVKDGLFQVKLGEVTPFTPAHFSGTDRWLGIQVGTETEMSPRTKLSSVGYALQALETDPTWQGGGSQGSAIGRTGPVGIGIASPAALLHTEGLSTGEGNVVFVGQYKGTSPGEPPVSGAGTRMMWYPDKAAFRAGYVVINQWDQESIGNYSLATGFSTTASGERSTAIGSITKAYGYGSTAMGNETIATGNNSTAMGHETIAGGHFSTAMGSGTSAYGVYSTALGVNTSASGNSSTALGVHTSASGYCSTALGAQTSASGYYSIALGNFSTASAYAVVATGRFNTGGGNASTWIETDPLFEIGNGTLISATNNAFTVLKNGNVGIGTSSPGYRLTVNGSAWCSAGAWTGSDIRWKRDITPLDQVLPQVLDLQAVNYLLRTEEFPEMGFSSDPQLGLIAQEVEKIFPQLVATDPDGFKSIAYDKLSVLLLEAVKEQQAEIGELTFRLERLERALESLVEK